MDLTAKCLLYLQLSSPPTKVAQLETVHMNL